MSIQTLAWAIDQQLPAKPKLVLIALANHAEPGTGYCRFDAGPIAREASTSRAGLWGYLGALERNGFISKTIRKTRRGEERDYWLILSRDAAEPWGADEVPDSKDDDLRTDEYREFLKETAA